MPVKVRRAIKSQVAYDSGFERPNVHPGNEAVKPETFMVRMQKQRRPPLSGAFLVTDLIDVATVASVARPLNRE
jgi:hypothetical protein